MSALRGSEAGRGYLARLAWAVAATAAVAVLGCPGVVLAAWSVRAGTGSTGLARSAALLAGPSSVTATCVSSTSTPLALHWSAVSAAASYTVLESTSSSTSGYVTAASGVTTTSYTTATLALGTYWFEVEAAAGQSWLGPPSAAAGPRTITASGGCF